MGWEEGRGARLHWGVTFNKLHVKRNLSIFWLDILLCNLFICTRSEANNHPLPLRLPLRGSQHREALVTSPGECLRGREVGSCGHRCVYLVSVPCFVLPAVWVVFCVSFNLSKRTEGHECGHTHLPRNRFHTRPSHLHPQSAPVIDLTKLGYFKVLGKGELPKVPVIVKAKFFTKLAEKRIKATGGACLITA